MSAEKQRTVFLSKEINTTKIVTKMTLKTEKYSARGKGKSIMLISFPKVVILHDIFVRTEYGWD
jgi:hypothetical protein